MNATLHRHHRHRTLLATAAEIDSGGDDPGGDHLTAFLGALLLKVSRRGPFVAAALRADIAAVAAEFASERN